MNFSRIWRLDIQETVYDVESELKLNDKKPIAIRGRILEDQEIIDDINVADSDVLLYEVKFSENL